MLFLAPGAAGPYTTSMPTATSTVTKADYSSPLSLRAAAPLKMSSPPSPISSKSTTTTAALHTLYNRAARAFLLRDIPLTYSLIESAFLALPPPVPIPDALAHQRRKWDILRITLESTVYSSPPSANESLPNSLQDNQIKSPQEFLTAIHARSLSLFSRSSIVNSAHLPTQVLITLIYSSLRVNFPDVGRSIIEDWLACRETPISSTTNGDTDGGYEKILELYCLQILPKLEQWDYAQEFLGYEGESSVVFREVSSACYNFYVSF